MEYTFFDFLTLIGSLGLFLYGMKVMSEGLQKVAGDRLRGILTAMTTNRVTGVLTGVLITALIQSSSATTVMVVSFVNAGLLSLTQSVSVIMGANVGTTVTAWIISIFGFKVNISLFAIPLIGLAIPFIFSGNSRRRSWGEFIIGFAFLFMGLEFLKNSVPDIQNNPEILSFLTEYTNMGYLSVLLFLLIGTIVTIVVQSSSATMAITLIMCSKGWISFDIAAAMVLGENIGTTITANLAAAVANVQAKRAALAHFIINVFGVIWLFLIFTPFLNFIGDLCVTLHLSTYNPKFSDPKLLNEAFSPEARAGVTASINAAMPLVLSLFNTLAKGINVAILIWFTEYLARIVSRIIPPKKGEETFTLKHIKIGLLSTPDASLFQAKQEISLYGQSTLEMFHKTIQAFDMPSGEYEKEFDYLQKMEDESDQVEVEIADYLTKVSESRLTSENSQRVRAMFKIVSEVESVADSILNVAKAIYRRNEQKITFPEELSNKLKHMFALVDESIVVMCANLATEYTQVTPRKPMNSNKPSTITGPF